MAVGPTSMLLVLLLLLASTSLAAAGIVGVNYGRVANNLPSPSAVATLLKTHSIPQIKLYDADPTVLSSFANTNIKLTVALPNENLSVAATSPSFATSWLKSRIVPFLPHTLITTIAVGNEVFVAPKNLTRFLVPAMTNLHSALVSLHLDDVVKVSSPIALTALGSSFPSSSGAFREDLAESVMKPMLELIRSTNSSLMVNVYPFFAYAANADVISLDYSLFRPNAGVVDAGNGLTYYSLFDAQVDAIFAATKRLGYDDVKLVVSETGWPSKGDPAELGASPDNAAAYNGNLIRRVLAGKSGTPMKPEADIDVYLFALFNENQKPGPTSERNYGLFYPNEEKVYDVEFSLGGSGLKWQEVRGRKKSSYGRAVTRPTTGETWCVANAMAGKERLQKALDYACGVADCEKIQPGKDCYDPDTIEAHASFAFNSYYQKNERKSGSCYFEGAAYVVNQSPKIGKCELPTRV